MRLLIWTFLAKVLEMFEVSKVNIMYERYEDGHYVRGLLRWT